MVKAGKLTVEVAVKVCVAATEPVGKPGLTTSEGAVEGRYPSIEAVHTMPVDLGIFTLCRPFRSSERTPPQLEVAVEGRRPTTEMSNVSLVNKEFLVERSFLAEETLRDQVANPEGLMKDSRPAIKRVDLPVITPKPAHEDQAAKIDTTSRIPDPRQAIAHHFHGSVAREVAYAAPDELVELIGRHRCVGHV